MNKILIMKEIIFLLVSFLASVLLTSCEPVDDLQDPVDFTTQIMGKWYPVETISKGTIIPYTGHEDCGRDFLDFSQDYKVQYVDILNCRQRILKYGNFNVTGYLLTINYNEKEKVIMKIANLDAASMDLIFTDDLNGDGVVEETLRYSRN